MAAVLMPCVAWATTARMASLQELTVLADVIVVGDVTAYRAEWRGTRILTDHTLEIRELWKGDTDTSALRLMTLGGVVDGIGQHVAGEPALPVGQHAVFFLVRDGADYRTVGMWQGAFLVGEGDNPQLTRPGNGVHVVGPTPTIPAGLADLKTAVLELIRAQ